MNSFLLFLLNRFIKFILFINSLIEKMQSKKRKYNFGVGVPPTKNEGFKPMGPNKIEKDRSYVTRQEIGRLISQKQENKVFDLAVNLTNATYAGSIIDLCAVTQGITEITRIGDELMPKRLLGRFQLNNADTTNTYRCIIFRWKQNDTVAPTVGGILESSGPSTIQACYVPLNVNTRSTFEVLYDKTYCTYSNANQCKFFSFDLKLAKKKIEYSFSTTAGQNKIYMLLISDSSAVTHPTFLGYTRLMFTDS